MARSGCQRSAAFLVSPGLAVALHHSRIAAHKSRITSLSIRQRVQVESSATYSKQNTGAQVIRQFFGGARAQTSVKTCQLIFAVSHSKQRTGARIKCQFFAMYSFATVQSEICRASRPKHRVQCQDSGGVRRTPKTGDAQTATLRLCSGQEGPLRLRSGQAGGVRQICGGNGRCAEVGRTQTSLGAARDKGVSVPLKTRAADRNLSYVEVPSYGRIWGFHK